MSPEDLLERVRARHADALLARGEITLTVPREEILETLRWLRDDEALGFRFFADVSCTDWPDREPRMWLAYHLARPDASARIRVKVGLPGDDLSVPSVTPEFPAADWHEREMFDFFGVRFEGHPDLRRIMMPDGWEGHPLRKDHAMGGVSTPYHGASIPPADERGL
ncbi:MAG TPA: NADH-quinone oxidoreductase subunit C [Actinomycetota bacterium]|nr:NADH-quinone oxidoreductase subunit C [Actinomycetota bacterium]